MWLRRFAAWPPNIAASSNEVAKPSYDPENILNILRTGFGVPIPSLVQIHQRFAEIRHNFLFGGSAAVFDWLYRTNGFEI